MKFAERFVRYVGQSRAQAAAGAGAATIACLVLSTATAVFPPLFLGVPIALLASVAVVALTVMRVGPSDGVIVAMPAVFVWALPVMLVVAMSGSMESAPGDSQAALPVESFRFMAWLQFLMVVGLLFVPAALAANVLRALNAQGPAVTVAAIVVGGLAALLVAGGPEPLLSVAEHARATALAMIPGSEMREIGPVSGAISAEGAFAVGRVASMLFVIVAAVVLVARWGHAVLDNPGGFGAEFRSLRLGKAPAVGLGLLAAFGVLIGAKWALAFLPVLVTLFVFQALAVAHALVRARGMDRRWLTGLYVLLLFPLTSWIVGPFAAAAGLADSWMDFRARAGATG